MQVDGALSVGVLASATLLLPVGPDFVREGVVQKELWSIGSINAAHGSSIPPNSAVHVVV